jgi:hypothetical protein
MKNLVDQKLHQLNKVSFHKDEKNYLITLLSLVSSKNRVPSLS